MKTRSQRVGVEDDGDEEGENFVKLKLPLGEAAAAEAFNLEKAVCSHGLFMMSPNHWEPLTHTFSRPLRLNPSSSSSSDDGDADYSTSSVMVSISHPSDHPQSLLVRVHGTRSLSMKHQESILGQVVRMLRLSDEDEKNARAFQKMVVEAEEGERLGMMISFGGRVFRSPTLFEDMVKCILLCNCQWSRSLCMARALCELQPELQAQSSSGLPIVQEVNANADTPETGTISFVPNTPGANESKRKLRVPKVSTNSTSRFLKKTDSGTDCNLRTDLVPSFTDSYIEGDSCERCKICSPSTDLHKCDHYLASGISSPQGMERDTRRRICNFPSPWELANVDERFLAKRCNLGYRASRIIKLARGIVEQRILLRQLEVVSNAASLSRYNELADQLRQIEGFGPFTCANVLMCMGFYHVIPTDSETVRHLKQVHGRSSTIQTIQRDVELIYGKYAPYQFLAYWAELWHFYEQRFGKLSELPCSDYKVITASNMKNKVSQKNKRTKISS